MTIDDRILDTAVAELELYGADPRTLAQMSARGLLYIRDLQGLTITDIMRRKGRLGTREINRRKLKGVAQALRRYFDGATPQIPPYTTKAKAQEETP